MKGEQVKNVGLDVTMKWCIKSVEMYKYCR